MKKIVKLSLATAMLMGMGAVSAQAADGITIIDGVYVKGELRPRYEMVDTDNTTGNANAMTNRLVIGAGSDKLFGSDMLGAYVEMTNISSLNDDNYNSTANGNPNNKNVVADPEQTRVTQAYIDVKLGDAKIRYGRQLMNLDNQRFIGAVGWRQMFQTYDATTLTYNGIKDLNVFISYVKQRNTVKLEDAKDAKDILTNISYKVSPELKVTAYSYMIASTHDTYGLALTGKVGVSDSLKVNYRAEYATQDDATMDRSNGPDNVKADADYLRLELGVNMSGILAGVGYEVLSGSNASGSKTSFTTPYATLHGHNGWADVFLANGGNVAGGLEDATVYAGYKAKGFGLLKVIYHDFSSDTGETVYNGLTADNYGTEIDAVYKNKIPGVKGLNGLLKYADYSADDYGIDTQKIWVMLDYKFSSK